MRVCPPVYLRNSIENFLHFQIKMIDNPAGNRNKDRILEVMKKFVDSEKRCNLLEISSGPGLHAFYYAQKFPNMTIQPSEFMREFFPSIEAYRENCTNKNVNPPIFIDIRSDVKDWEGKFGEKELKDCVNHFDFMLSINMIHITSIACSEGLFKNSSKLLKPGGILFTYGTYKENGVLEPLSNFLFDQHLRSNDPTWGVRDIVELDKFAKENSMELFATYELPTHSKCLVWRKN
jgi:SAM-dependent methyltransferase